MNNMTPFEQLIALNLYLQDSKKTGLFDLPDLEVLVNQYQQQKTLPFKSPSPKEDQQEKPLSPSLKENPQQNPNLTTTPVVPNPPLIDNNKSPEGDKTLIVNGGSTNNDDHSTKIGAIIIEGDKPNTSNSSSSQNEPISKPSSSSQESKEPTKISPEMERLIFELYLEEIAENLSTGSPKALPSTLQPNLKTLQSF